MYDNENFFYLERTHNEELGEVIVLASAENGVYREDGMVQYGNDKIYLKAVGEYNKVRFYYSEDKEGWNQVGPVMDMLRLSDERCRLGRYTGSMTGIAAIDLIGTRHSADFFYFDYMDNI